MSSLITRELFIAPDIKSIASALPTMFVFGKDGQTVDEVPMPQSVKDTGILPEGYSIDFAMDPSTLVAALAKQGVTTQDQLNYETLSELRMIINSHDNIKIVPTTLHEEKRKMEDAAAAQE